MSPVRTRHVPQVFSRHATAIHLCLVRVMPEQPGATSLQVHRRLKSAPAAVVPGRCVLAMGPGGVQFAAGSAQLVGGPHDCAVARGARGQRERSLPQVWRGAVHDGAWRRELWCCAQGTGVLEIALDPVTNRTGDVWHVCVHGLRNVGLMCYGWRADGDVTWESECAATLRHHPAACARERRLRDRKPAPARLHAACGCGRRSTRRRLLSPHPRTPLPARGERRAHRLRCCVAFAARRCRALAAQRAAGSTLALCCATRTRRAPCPWCCQRPPTPRRPSCCPPTTPSSPSPSPRSPASHRCVRPAAQRRRPPPLALSLLDTAAPQAREREGRRVAGAWGERARLMSARVRVVCGVARRRLSGAGCTGRAGAKAGRTRGPPRTWWCWRSTWPPSRRCAAGHSACCSLAPVDVRSCVRKAAKSVPSPLPNQTPRCRAQTPSGTWRGSGAASSSASSTA